MKVTPHFNLEEFDCRDGTSYPSDWEISRLLPLCEALEKIRAKAGGPIHIASGYRTPAHNKRIGGAKRSQHIYGRAVDIMCRAVSAKKLGQIIERLIKAGEIPDGGLGVYHSWCHYDQRGSRARWTV